MKYFLVVITLFLTLSSQAFEMKKIAKWLSGSYKDVKSPSFECPDKMKKFSSKELTDKANKVWEVACEDDKGKKFGFLFAGDVLTGIQYGSKPTEDLCKSKEAFLKQYKQPNWDYRYAKTSNFEQQAIFFAAEFTENKNFYFSTGVCSKNRFFTFFKRHTKSSMNYLSDSFIK